MSKKPRGLGSGFAALISQTSSSMAAVSTEQVQDRLLSLPIDQLISGRFQPRTQWDESRLQELADSIQSQGVVQPIVVRLIQPQKYEIIAGERRWRAAKIAGLTEIPVLLKRLDDQEAMAISLIENIQREDLSAIEEARAIKRLIDGFELTHDQIAQILGRSRESISNLLRLLKLHLTVQEAVLDGQLSAGHARALLPLEEADQQRLAQQAISLLWSVRETEQAVKQSLAAEDISKDKQTASLSSEMHAWQQQIADRMGTTVKFKVSSSGKGKIEISFRDYEELQRVIARF